MTDYLHLFWCETCQKYYDFCIEETGYEPGPNPTAYEDYDICAICGRDVIDADEIAYKQERDYRCALGVCDE